jgi:hypothetical protein
MDINKHIGKQFGKLIVLEFAFVRNRHYYWKCKCECGIEKNIVIDSLLSGKTNSCGCYRKENMMGVKNRNYKHGEGSSRLYQVWMDMRIRCLNPNSIFYKRYGGRGIKICDEWENNFISFRKWAVVNGYDDKLEIDRINNNGDYCPENCRWISHKENTKNRECCNNFLFDGIHYTLPELAVKFKINKNTLASRIYSYGWSLHEALSHPKGVKRSYIKNRTQKNGL